MADRVDQILLDFQQLKKTVASMQHKKVRVGIVGKQDSEVLKIAHIHEYGDGKMPERSFLRASFDVDREKLKSIIDEQVKRVLSGQYGADMAAKEIGGQAAQLVQNYINDDRVRPQSDFSQKQVFTTLYETGTHILERIAYEVE